MAHPATWQRLLGSAEVGVGEVRGADIDGSELVAWRGADGAVVVSDARCPHLWSHLEGEGVVDGCELVCAAHFWRFDATGHGTKLNVLGRRDVKSDIRVYPSREVEGFVEVALDPRPPGG